MAKQYTANRDDNSKVVAVGAAALGSLALLLLLRGRKGEGVGLDLEISITDQDMAPVSGIKITIVGDGTFVTTGADGKEVILGAGEAGDQLQIQITDPLGEYQPVDPQPVTIVLSDDDGGVCRRSYVVVPTAVQTVVISGKVTNSDTGAAIAGAAITVGTASATSDTSGNYSVTTDKLVGASATVNCTKSGFEAFSSTITLPSLQTTLNIPMTPTVGPYSNLTLTITSSAGGYLDNATVQASWQGQPIPVPVPWSPGDNAYVLDNVILLQSPAITVNLSVSAPGHLSTNFSYSADQVDKLVTKELTESGAEFSNLTLRVASSAGGYLDNASVQITWTDLSDLHDVPWNSQEQTYVLDNTIPLQSPALTVYVYASAPSHEAGGKTYVADQAEETQEITLTLLETVPFVVTVHDYVQDIPVPGATVRFEDDEGNLIQIGATNASGVASLDNALVAGDKVNAKITKSGYYDNETGIVTIPSGVFTVNRTVEFKPDLPPVYFYVCTYNAAGGGSTATQWYVLHNQIIVRDAEQAGYPQIAIALSDQNNPLNPCARFTPTHGVKPGTMVYLDASVDGYEPQRVGPVMVGAYGSYQYTHLANMFMVKLQTTSDLDITTYYPTLAGYVPLAGVSIWIGASNPTYIGDTNSSGKLYVAGAAPKGTNVVITATYPGLCPRSVTQYCDDNAEVVPIYFLEPGPASLDIHVINQDGLPVPDAEIWLDAVDSGTALGTTNASGHCVIASEGWGWEFLQNCFTITLWAIHRTLLLQGYTQVTLDEPANPGTIVVQYVGL